MLRLKTDHEGGFRFRIYESRFRHRDYINEISAVRETRSGILGYSWQCGIMPQKELRKIRYLLQEAEIPVTVLDCTTGKEHEEL